MQLNEKEAGYLISVGGLSMGAVSDCIQQEVESGVDSYCALVFSKEQPFLTSVVEPEEGFVIYLHVC